MLQIILTGILYLWLFAVLALLWAIYQSGRKQAEALQEGLLAVVFKKAESAHIAAEAARTAAEAARVLAIQRTTGEDPHA